MALKNQSTVTLWLSMFLGALLCATAFGEAVAKIDGPETSEAGNLVVLNSGNSKGHVKRWIIPPALENRYIQTESQIAFSVRESGEFRFALVAVDVTGEATADVDVATHTIAITNGICDPVTPDPSDPDGPTNPDPPANSQLREISRDAAAKLNDPTTASALAAAISAVNLGTLDAMKADAQAAIESALLERKGASRDADWLSTWRRPINDGIKATTPGGFLADLQAIASGLIDSVGSAKPPVPAPVPDQPSAPKTFVTMFSRPDCSWCNRWKSEVWPTLESWDWELKEVFSTQSVPQFEIASPGFGVAKMTGFQDVEKFRKFK
ncbi:hypothetical protein Pla52o_35270 [Novipirellula galeiformis]|uniref:Thioredoxin domain-containing protein n=1 Tax=Novipirellula galeiformis TaxID=2528004 RepID=A0A5C6CGR7_9BACT|nr:hypothetical protein [Novipirellula galeiformis]TWU22471.1 hypothetical protein Pla52o_35270 [Novipirellula galeiformis]